MESLDTARKIQESVLPKAFGDMGARYGLDLHALLIPAKEVSGDLYDFFPTVDGRICLLVGDVSDKGVPSAFFMAMTRTLIRAAVEATLEPQVILARVNEELCRDNDLAMFVTLFLSIYDPESGALVYSDAGHNPPYRLQVDRSLAAVTGGEGIALGIMRGMEFRREEITLSPGEMVFAYTDGITEAARTDGRLFGAKRLEETLARNVDSGPRAVSQTVLENVQTFVEDAAQSDDMTILSIRRR